MLISRRGQISPRTFIAPGLGQSPPYVLFGDPDVLLSSTYLRMSFECPPEIRSVLSCRPPSTSSAGLVSEGCPPSRLRVFLSGHLLISSSLHLEGTCGWRAESVAYLCPPAVHSVRGTCSCCPVVEWWRLCRGTFGRPNT